MSSVADVDGPPREEVVEVVDKNEDLQQKLTDADAKNKDLQQKLAGADAKNKDLQQKLDAKNKDSQQKLTGADAKSQECQDLQQELNAARAENKTLAEKTLPHLLSRLDEEVVPGLVKLLESVERSAEAQDVAIMQIRTAERLAAAVELGVPCQDQKELCEGLLADHPAVKIRDAAGVDESLEYEKKGYQAIAQLQQIESRMAAAAADGAVMLTEAKKQATQANAAATSSKAHGDALNLELSKFSVSDDVPLPADAFLTFAQTNLTNLEATSKARDECRGQHRQGKLYVSQFDKTVKTHGDEVKAAKAAVAFVKGKREERLQVVSEHTADFALTQTSKQGLAADVTKTLSDATAKMEAQTLGAEQFGLMRVASILVSVMDKVGASQDARVLKNSTWWKNEELKALNKGCDAHKEVKNIGDETCKLLKIAASGCQEEETANFYLHNLLVPKMERNAKTVVLAENDQVEKLKKAEQDQNREYEQTKYLSAKETKYIEMNETSKRLAHAQARLDGSKASGAQWVELGPKAQLTKKWFNHPNKPWKEDEEFGQDKEAVEEMEIRAVQSAEKRAEALAGRVPEPGVIDERSARSVFGLAAEDQTHLSVCPEPAPDEDARRENHRKNSEAARGVEPRAPAPEM